MFVYLLIMYVLTEVAVAVDTLLAALRFFTIKISSISSKIEIKNRSERISQLIAPVNQ